MNTTKPDPDEPWRYCCPDCDSVMVRRLLEPAHGADGYGAGGVGNKRHKEQLKHRYTCNECEWRGKDVYDRKKDRPAAPWKP